MPRWHVAPLVFRAPEAPAARWGGLLCVPTGVPGAGGPGRCVCRWAAARPRAVRAASFARRVASKPGQAPPPPTGTAADPSGALHTSWAWCAEVWFGALSRDPARPRHRPWVPPPGPVGQLGRLSETAIAFVGAGRALSETAIAFAGAGRALSETAVTFARSRSRGIETVVAFAGEKWAFLVQFSGAEVMPVSRLPCWGRAVVLSVSMSPCCRASCAKKFALRGLMWVCARNSSPCALKTAKIRHFCACWANFFAEKSSEGLCWANSFARAAREEARLGLVVSRYALSAADSSCVTSPCTLGG